MMAVKVTYVSSFDCIYIYIYIYICTVCSPYYCIAFNIIIGLFIDSYNISIGNNNTCINYKHVANMKSTIYGNGLPRETQVKKGSEPLL
jgi:hypothetical protein